MANVISSYRAWIAHTLQALRNIPRIRLSVLRKVFSLMGTRERIVIFLLVCTVFGSITYQTLHWYGRHLELAPVSGGNYEEGIVGQPQYLNPVLATTETDRSINHILFAGLYAYDSQGKLVPDLAESLPEISSDQKNYIVHLKQNITWHDQAPITADDIVFTLSAIQNPEIHSPLQELWSSTKVEKIDVYTLRFTTKEVSAPFVNNLTLQPIPKHIWTGLSPNEIRTSRKNLEPTGSGPYRLKTIHQIKNGAVQSLTLAAIDQASARTPSITLIFCASDQACLTLLQSKHIAGFSYVPYETGEILGPLPRDTHVFSTPVLEYQALFFNTTQPLVNTPAVRQFLSQTIDREAVAENIFNKTAQPAFQPILPNQLGAMDAATSAEHNPDSILLKDGWQKQNGAWVKNAQRLELTLTTTDSVLNQKTAALLKQEWETVGVSVEVRVVPTEKFFVEIIKPRDFQLVLFGHSLGIDPDPFAFWHSSQIADPGLNITGFQNAEADGFITRGRTTTNTTARIEAYTKFQAVFNRDVPAVILTQPKAVYLLNTRITPSLPNLLPDNSWRLYWVTAWYSKQKPIFKGFWQK